MATVIIEHSDLAGSERLGQVLRDHGHRLEVIRVHRGDSVPTSLEEVDAVVACGGPQDPLDDSIEWVESAKNLLRQAHEAALPTVGICFGNQILVRALGGEIGKLEGGIECGFGGVTLTPTGREDPLFAGIAWKSPQIHWHRFHITKIPPGARVLAKSERTPVQAWAAGLRTYGIQYHPEALDTTMMAWADDDPADIKEAGLTREQLGQQLETHYAGFERLADRFFETMALTLMPVDRRIAGVVKDLHH